MQGERGRKYFLPSDAFLRNAGQNSRDAMHHVSTLPELHSGSSPSDFARSSVLSFTRSPVPSFLKKGKMIFAYLILVHKNPQQLAMLIRSLMDDNVYFIIHIDRKVCADGFVNSLPVSENIIFSKRVKVSWGGFGMIEATREMLRAMYAHNIQPDYVHLISGQDFPLKSNREIFRFFRENRSRNFLESHPIPSPRLSELGLNRIQYKWFIEDEGYHQASHLVEIQKQRNMIRPFLPGIQPYNGSQWWSLTGECVQWLYRTCRPGNRLYVFYRYTFCSDEMLFHTALLNSEWKDSITDNNLRCINWERGPEYPRVWRSEDFGYLSTCGKLYARKFDETTDREILNRFEKHRRAKPKSMKKSIILFRFHKEPQICLNRLELLKLYNPDIPVYGIYGGKEEEFKAFERLLSRHLSGIYLIKNRTGEWKWQNFDLALREWYRDAGKDIDFDMAYVVEWDMLIFGPLKEIYANVPDGALGLTGLAPLSSIEHQWFWTTGTWRNEYVQLMEYVRKTCKYSKTPCASLGGGLCFPKPFLTEYSAMLVPELSHDEIRVPLFAQILGYSIKDTGIFDWFDAEEHKYFNPDGRIVPVHTINSELKKKQGRKVFHPFRDIYPLEKLERNIIKSNKKQTLPKIIHQIWSEKYRPLPEFCASLSETWKEKHPDWKYIRWDEEMMNTFVEVVYPGLLKFYQSLPYDMQRWDVIRFLILYKMGGMHVDFDYKCLKNIEPLLPEGKECCISTEPQTHASKYHVQNLLNSALLASVPKSVFVGKLIEKAFSRSTLQFRSNDKSFAILNTTGPLMVSRVYESLSQEDRESVHLIPAKNVTPYDTDQIRQINSGIRSEELDNCLKEASAIHYFTYTWGTAF
jgi:mannosyltransferase OCH1-like enzyme